MVEDIRANSHHNPNDIHKLDDFSAFLEASTDLYCLLDEAGYIQLTNRAFQHVTGYEAHELPGKPYSQFIHANNLKLFQKLLLRKKNFTLTYQCQSKDGEYIQIQSNCSFFTNQDGNERTIICSQKWGKNHSLQHEIEGYKSDLEKLTHMVSHDLKAPLRSISGLLNIIETRHSDALGSNGAELVHFTRHEAEKMKMMIDDLAEYSRIKSRHHDESMTDLGEIIKEVKEMLQKTPDLSDYEIVLHDDLPHIKCNTYLITLLWYHLLSNALSISPTKRLRLEISAQAESDAWLFTLKDNGKGIEEIYHQKFFEPFLKIPGTQKAGSGMGLAIAKRIVKRYGGSIWMDSEVASGTTFYFTIRK